MSFFKEKEELLLELRPARVPFPTERSASSTRQPPLAVLSSLHQIGRRDLTFRFAEGALLLIGGLACLCFLQAAADWTFNLSRNARLLLLVLDLALLGYSLFHLFWQPWRCRLTIRAAALLAERTLPELDSALISTVDLATAPVETRIGASPLIQELCSRTNSRIRDLDLPRRVIPTTRLRQISKWVLLTLMVLGAIGAYCWPKTPVLLARLFLSSIPLPTRTVVIPITHTESIVAGSDFALAAKAEGVLPKTGHVKIIYDNKDRDDLIAAPTLESPNVYSVSMKNVQQSFHYRFTLNDGTGEEYAVTAITPPELADFRCHQTYPPYMKKPEADMAIGNLSLFAGSQIQIEGASNQELSSAVLNLDGLKQQIPLTIDANDKKLIHGSFKVPVKGLTGLSLKLTNTNGVPSQADAIYQVELLPDRPPVVKLSAPVADRLTIMLRSKPHLVYSVRDDFGVGKVLLKYKITRPADANGQTSPDEEGGITLPPIDPASAEKNQTYVWDIGSQTPPWTEGCTVTYWIEAYDNNDVTGPGITSGKKKSLLVISEAEKQAEFQDMLNSQAALLDHIYHQQTEANQQLDRSLRKNQP